LYILLVYATRDPSHPNIKYFKLFYPFHCCEIKYDISQIVSRLNQKPEEILLQVIAILNSHNKWLAP